MNSNNSTVEHSFMMHKSHFKNSSKSKTIWTTQNEFLDLTNIDGTRYFMLIDDDIFLV